MSSVTELLDQIPFLKTAFEEQQAAIRGVWAHAKDILRVDETIAKQFQVTLGPMPDSILGFQHNMFSTVFLAVLQPLGIAPERRRLYGKLNHLFRAWVTSADNLLDDEDKVTFPVQLPGNAHVMRQVVVIMLADRIMVRILAEALADGVLTPAEAQTLSDESLRVLLASAAEEASEEGGLKEWPDPEYVLDQLHPLKTGILFYIPFLGPEKIEKNIDHEKLTGLKRALLDFGIGCQMLDDIRDLARDYTQRRANYVISRLVHGSNGKREIETLDKHTRDGDLDKRLDQFFPDETSLICRAATARLEGSFEALDALGLTGFALMAQGYAAMLTQRLDLAHLVGHGKNPAR
jgi:hypothetical protein